MSGEELARRSLAADAAYCAAAAVLVTTARRPLATWLELPVAAVGAAGAATLGWAGVVGVLARRAPWRPATAGVAAANVAACGLLAGLALRRPRPVQRAVLGAAMLEVGGFAASQLVALRGPERLVAP